MVARLAAVHEERCSPRLALLFLGAVLARGRRFGAALFYRLSQFGAGASRAAQVILDDVMCQGHREDRLLRP